MPGLTDEQIEAEIQRRSTPAPFMPVHRIPFVAPEALKAGLLRPAPAAALAQNTVFSMGRALRRPAGSADSDADEFDFEEGRAGAKTLFGVRPPSLEQLKELKELKEVKERTPSVGDPRGITGPRSPNAPTPPPAEPLHARHMAVAAQTPAPEALIALTPPVGISLRTLAPSDVTGEPAAGRAIAPTVAGAAAARLGRPRGLDPASQPQSVSAPTPPPALASLSDRIQAPTPAPEQIRITAPQVVPPLAPAPAAPVGILRRPATVWAVAAALVLGAVWVGDTWLARSRSDDFVRRAQSALVELATVGTASPERLCERIDFFCHEFKVSCEELGVYVRAVPKDQWTGAEDGVLRLQRLNKPYQVVEVGFQVKATARGFLLASSATTAQARRTFAGSKELLELGEIPRCGAR